MCKLSIATWRCELYFQRMTLFVWSRNTRRCFHSQGSFVTGFHLPTMPCAGLGIGLAGLESAREILVLRLAGGFAKTFLLQPRLVTSNS